MTAKLKISLFAALILFQLGGFALIIYNHLQIDAQGETYYLKVELRDPYSPLLGRYLLLSSSLDDKIKNLNSEHTYRKGDEVFLLLDKDEQGFISPISLARDPPADGLYLKTQIRYINTVDNSARIKTVLNRFYVEEYTAQEAEILLQEHQRVPRDEPLPREDDPNIWLELKIYQGRAVAIELYIEGVPVVKAVQQRLAQAGRNKTGARAGEKSDNAGEVADVLADQASNEAPHTTNEPNATDNE